MSVLEAEGIERQLENEGRLKTPPTAEFGFPFTPYGIQEEFMQALFEGLEGRGLGIFESPTGTGKSLSLLCGSLTWLQRREAERVEYLEKLIRSVDLTKLDEQTKRADNWIKAQADARKITAVLGKARRELAFLEGVIKKRKDYLGRRKELGSSSNNRRVGGLAGKNADTKDVKEAGVGGDDLEDLVLNDEFAPVNYSDSEGEEEECEDEPEFYPYKIVFASRTHSQIAQFANELKRTKFSKEVTCTPLASRQNLCINQDVLKLKSLSLINERCLDLQKGSKGKQTAEGKKMKGCGGCPFYSYAAVEELKTQILSVPMDIEDLVKTGKECNACPYYASRKAAKDAQLVLVPYNSILHSSTREGVGIKVKNSAILLDEAHNIIESISNMYSTSVTLQHLQDSSNALKAYMQRYMSRFSAKNLLKLKQVAFVLKSLTQFLTGAQDNEAKVFSVHEFKGTVGIENLDFHELLKFMKMSKLLFKLKGFVLHQEKIAEKAALEQDLKLNNKVVPKPNGKIEKNKENSGKNKQPLKNAGVEAGPRQKKTFTGNAVLSFHDFFKALVTCDSQGKIILDKKTLKFLLVNTAERFQDLVNDARSIILAGGTMKPYDEIEDQLFQSSKDRIVHFSCDHVIPEENLLCMALSKGPTNVPFDFTFKNRNSPALLEELGRCFINLAKLVPGGLVCFLPSYEYESTLFAFLTSSGSKEKIETKKKIFRESKDSNCDTLLSEYSRQIKNNPNGAILFAVVGGKLSEGINFCDDLGRCVVVVGLPYPNITSMEIKEKVKFASERFGKEKGDQLLTNMCSKAINQSIGRAIRHSQDYATILLLDTRFSRPAQRDLLPNWISKRFQTSDSFGQVVKSVSSFFQTKKSTS